MMGEVSGRFETNDASTTILTMSASRSHISSNLVSRFVSVFALDTSDRLDPMPGWTIGGSGLPTHLDAIDPG